MSDVATRVHYDRSERKYHFERVQDVEPIIENNKRLQTETQDRKSSFRQVASIPMVFLEKWLNEEYQRGNTGIRLFDDEFNRLVARKLQDPDYKWLRTDK